MGRRYANKNATQPSPLTRDFTFPGFRYLRVVKRPKILSGKFQKYTIHQFGIVRGSEQRDEILPRSVLPRT